MVNPDEPTDITALTTDDQIANVVYQYEFNFYSSLKTPLSYQEVPMPGGCGYIFRFTRAQPSLSLMRIPYDIFKTIDNRFTQVQYGKIPGVSTAYDNQPIPMVNPELHVAFTTDKDTQRRTQVISKYGLQIPFLDFSMRRNMLSKGIAEFEVRLADLEKTPEQIIFALTYV